MPEAVRVRQPGFAPLPQRRLSQEPTTGAGSPLPHPPHPLHQAPGFTEAAFNWNKLHSGLVQQLVQRGRTWKSNILPPSGLIGTRLQYLSPEEERVHFMPVRQEVPFRSERNTSSFKCPGAAQHPSHVDERQERIPRDHQQNVYTYAGHVTNNRSCL